MRVFSALTEDSQQGWVWLGAPNLPPRSIVKLTNQKTGLSIYCEALQIDSNFLRAYNEAPRISIAEPAKTIVINAWYRAKLGGLATQQDVQLRIVPANSPLGRFVACVDHPQAVVRVAAWLGALGVLLGIVSIILGAASLMPRPDSPPSALTQVPVPVRPRLDQLLLYAELKNGYLAGKIFNQEPNVVVTSITVEAIPRDETNPFNKMSPRYFEIDVRVPPYSMSQRFQAETGALNPDFHTLRIAAARGYRRDE